MASTEGLPIIRPLWLEFPTNEQTFGVQDQFMFGSSILVAPRLTFQEAPFNKMTFGNSESIFMDAPPPQSKPRDLHLPSTASWFDLKSKMAKANDGDVFVRSGTILPILLHKNALSLQRAIHNDVRLEVYGARASG